MAENTEIDNDFIQIIDAEALDNMKMILSFSNGETRLFDAKILDGSAFEPLKSKEIFKDCTIVDGVVTWLDEETDCAPEWMYSHSTTINEYRKDNTQAFILDDKKSDAFLHRKIPTSTDVLNRFKKRKKVKNKNV